MPAGTLQIAYTILYKLEHNPGYSGYMAELIGPKALKCDKAAWVNVIEELSEEGYIKGIRISEDILGNELIDINKAKITLKGAAYLQENSAFKKFAEIATDIISVIK